MIDTAVKCDGGAHLNVDHSKLVIGFFREIADVLQVKVALVDFDLKLIVKAELFLNAAGLPALSKNVPNCR